MNPACSGGRAERSVPRAWEVVEERGQLVGAGMFEQQGFAGRVGDHETAFTGAEDDLGRELQVGHRHRNHVGVRGGP